MTVGQIFVTVGRLSKTLGGIKKPMKRKFIGERGPKVSSQDRQINSVLYSIDEALQIFIRAKTAEGVRSGTIKGYHEIFRYFRQWLDKDISNINEISADIM